MKTLLLMTAVLKQYLVYSVKILISVILVGVQNKKVFKKYVSNFITF